MSSAVQKVADTAVDHELLSPKKIDLLTLNMQI